MRDLERVQRFCDQIKEKNTYPNALKNLNHISGKTKDILIKIIKKDIKRRLRSGIDCTELVLISRYLNPKPFLNEKFNKILGPTALYQLSSPDHPHIFYIFGDIHIKSGFCEEEVPTITKWIEETITSIPVFTDVYLEAPYTYKDYIAIELGQGNYLMDNYNSFLPCMKQYPDKKCKTSRFHYTDIRKMFVTESQSRGFLLMLAQWAEGLDSWTKEEANCVSEFYTYFTDPNSLIYKRILKQINNVDDTGIKKFLHKDFKKCTKTFKDRMTKSQLPTSNLSLKTAQKYILLMHPVLLSYANCLMDYYLLARCFRTYKKVNGKYSRPSYNNIIYVGGTHAINYVRILVALGFKLEVDKETNGEGEKNFQCLDVSTMKQPMFHQRF